MTSLENTRNWSMMAHISATIGQVLLPTFGFLGPVLIWVLRHKDPEVVRHARRALIFQGAMWAASWIIGIVAGMSCMFWFLGFFAVVPWLAGLIIPVIAGMRAQSGDPHSYPITDALFDR